MKIIVVTMLDTLKDNVLKGKTFQEVKEIIYAESNHLEGIEIKLVEESPLCGHEYISLRCSICDR